MGTVHDLYESFGIKEIQHNDEQYDTDEYWLIEYLAAFQKGDFSRKADFAALFTKSGDREVFCVGMRIFMAVCSHDDFELLMDFFENPDDYYDIRAFLVSVTESLSYQSIPYLLALHDLWANTVIAAEIAFILNGMLHFAPPDGLYEGKYGEYATEQIGEAFMAFGEAYDLNSYYYDGKEVFLGDLTKLLMGTAIYCMRNNKLFYSTEILSILSDSTGMACPVKTDEYVDEEQIGAILKYYRSAAEGKISERLQVFLWTFDPIGRDILKRQIEDLFDESDETEKICRDAIENQIDMKYNEFFRKICEYYSNCVSECLKDNSIWNELYTYWGDGIGKYKKRVIDRIKAELVRQNFEEKLKLENYFREYMIDIKSFLDISNKS